MPGHLTSFKVGGHFGAKGSSLNDRGAGEAIKALQLRVGKIPQRYLEPPQAYRELQAKQNKTKQNSLGDLGSILGIVQPRFGTSGDVGFAQQRCNQRFNVKQL